MPGVSRYQSVLELFTEARPSWTVPGISQALGVPGSTVYRTVRELVKAGFLEPSAGASYRLGAAFIVYDRLIRLTDPLARAGSGILQEAVRQAHVPCVGLLARLYHETVMCIADESTSAAGFRSSYQRGRLMPLTKGATSKVILAQLNGRKLGKLLKTVAEDTQPFGYTVGEFKENLGRIRKGGYCISRGEIDTGLVGIAAPIVAPDLGIIASLSLVLSADGLSDAIERRIILLTVSSAALVSEQLRLCDQRIPQAIAREPSKA
jgi:DNA-binding IclR family transcriptional regulator